jgi:DNA-binding SARP family transcriptional activator/tetratricopeptide (TPR) repeat protein/DNA-binding transcriptional regulator YiaG
MFLMLRNDHQAAGLAARPGRLIAESRQAAGLTQQQLADRAGVSVGLVRDLEQGRTTRPRGDTIERLARALGMDPALVSDVAGWPTAIGYGPAPAHAGLVAAPGIRLGVLGSLALWRDGVAADPGAGRQRAVLGLLAMYPGTAVHREMIIDAVWGARPPASVVPMVQTYASRLRRVLGDDLLVSDGTSYRLVVTVDQLDALEFAMLSDRAGQAATAGNPAAACRWYERALGLWRGEPLADVTAMRGHPAAMNLARQRAVVILEHAAAAAAAGCPEQALPQLQALAADHALDERVHARLMLTLAASGQQAAALSVFEQVRQRLNDELGVIPGAGLMAAHLRILRGELRSPGADAGGAVRLPRPRQHVRHGVAAGQPPDRAAPGTPASPAGPRQLPAVVPQFTGRASELAMLSRLADQAAGTAGTVVISAIGGMAGIGKTTLAVHWAHRSATSFPDGQLYADLRGFGLSGRPAAPGEVLHGFLDALGVMPAQVPAELDARAALYRSATAGKRLLIVLDNARNEQQVRPLLPGTPGSLVIVTSRHELTGLSAAEGAHLLTLDLLTASDARTLLTARLGAERAAADPGAVTEIAALCGRLPLALAITAARAAARPTFTLAALAAELRDAHGRLAALDTGDPAVGVRAAFSWSHAQLAPATARIFRVLGLHPGPSISLPAAASLAAIPAGQVSRHLAGLARAHLVTEHRPGRYALHDLLRAYAAEQAEATDDEAERRAALHRMLDHYLHTAYGAALLLNPSRDPITITPPQPDVAPEPLGSDREAMSWMESEHEVMLASARLATDMEFDSHAWQLPWTMTDFLDRRGHWSEMVALQQNALKAVTRLGDTAGQAVTHRLAANGYYRLADRDRARAHTEAALRLYQQIGDRIGEARSHQALGILANGQGRLAEALSHDESALSVFEAAGHRAGEARLHNSIGWTHVQLGDPLRGLAYCRQAVELHRELGDRAGEGHSWDSVGFASHRLGRLAEAGDCYRQALDIFQQLGDLFEEAWIHIHLGDNHHATGELAAARESWTQALAILDNLHHPDAGQVRARLRPPASS